MRKLLIGISLLGTLGLKAQYGSLNEILNRLEQRKGINQHLENVNIDDKEALLKIALSLGLDETETKRVLESNAFEEEVRFDIYESQQMGVRGVPFFVIDRKYALSGAQPVEAFKQAISQGYQEWIATQEKTPLTNLNTSSENTCDENSCEV